MNAVAFIQVHVATAVYKSNALYYCIAVNVAS